MLLSEPARTPYDFEFELMGFSVRVSAWFWLAAVFLGYPFSQSFGDDRIMALGVWIVVMFLSILVHEMGHALTFRKYGIHSSIVLYHFGGLAIPRGSFRGGNRSLTPWQHIHVSFAGPGIELLLALVVALCVRALDYRLPGFLQWLPGLQGGQPIDSPGLDAFVDSALFMNVLWAVLNLVPIWPLDGGQIAREIVRMMGGTLYHSSMISVGLCIIAGLWAYQTGYGSIFTYIFLGSFAFTNYQIAQGSSGHWR